MGNFQDTFETRKQSFISGFSIYMTVSWIISAISSINSLIFVLCQTNKHIKVKSK